MQVRKETDVFNLMDTNGRRKDPINAYNIYLSILNNLANSGDSSWDRFPNSLNQYKFYKSAIEASPEIFTRHSKFDEVQHLIDSHSDVKQAFINKDSAQLNKLFKKYKNWNVKAKLDNPIEGRARHYTSNLVKIGFTDKNRKLSSVGLAYLNGYKLAKDAFEELLPIKDGNLIFLRQLMKLKVYTKDYSRSYNPMMMAFYLLLNSERISQSTLLNLVVLLNPYKPINPEQVLNAAKNGVTTLSENYIDFTQNPSYKKFSNISGQIDEKTFTHYIHNKKSHKNNQIYYNFYLAIRDFQDTGNINTIFDLYSKNISAIDSAFGSGTHLFNWPRGRKNITSFYHDNRDNKLLNSTNLNGDIYLRYLISTRAVSVSEYSDTFRRVLNVSGIVSFDNGVAELMYKSLWNELFSQVDLKSLIFESYDQKQAKQEKINDNNLNSTFRNNISIAKIIGTTNIELIIANIKNKLHIATSEEVKHHLLSEKDKQFKSFVKINFSQDKVFKILKLFEDRTNDELIRKLVDSNASVPTIYEYIVGLAWYYISDDSYNLYDSFNLSMNADFRPETHAAGGEGDIVINYSNDILMLEVTLMNKQAQKRGEWEPVLRHTANLTIDSAPKKVRTLFIADELDPNTINIWRAVASVPMHSSQSTKSNLVANNITIMPIKNKELRTFLRKGISSKLLVQKISSSFEKLNQDFDEAWRDKILNAIIN